MNLNLKNKILLYNSTFAVIILAVLVAIIYPTIKQIKQVRQQALELREYLEKRSNRSSRVHLSLQQIAKIKSEVELFPNYLFKKGEELNLITTLESIAAKNHLTQKIENSNFDNITNNTIDLSLATAGNYANSIAYLNDLEKLKYFINLQRLELMPSASRANEKNNEINMRLNLSLYAND